MPFERLCLSMNQGKTLKNAFRGWNLGTRKPMFFLKSTALALTGAKPLTTLGPAFRKV